MEFNHFDQEGNAIMVDVSGKEITERTALAQGNIRVSREVFDAVAGRKVKKGMCLRLLRWRVLWGRSERRN